MPIVKTVKGDMVELFKNREICPLIAHYAVCTKKIDSSQIGVRLVEEFPELAAIDEGFPLPALYRLGDYSGMRTDFGSIVNFYVKFTVADPRMEYSALKSCLAKLTKEALASGNYLEVAVPFIEDEKIWKVVSTLYGYQENLLITVVQHDKGQVRVGEGEADELS